MKHPFFAPINWDELYNKKIAPQFIPDVSGADSVENVDPMFVSEQPGISPKDQSDIDKEEQKNFENFTYVSENKLATTEEVK